MTRAALKTLRESFEAHERMRPLIYAYNEYLAIYFSLFFGIRVV